MPDVHRFDPREEIRREADFVIARCACGWEGNAFPEHPDGYEDAELEFERHAEASRHDSRR